MRDHELDVFGRVPGAASTAAATSASTAGGGVPNGRGPFSPPAQTVAAAAAVVQAARVAVQGAAGAAAAGAPPRRSLPALSTTAVAWSSSSVPSSAASSSIPSMEEPAVPSSSAVPLSANNAASASAGVPFGFGGSSGNTNTGKRPLASLDPNFSSAAETMMGGGGGYGGGEDDCSMMMTEEDFGGGRGIATGISAGAAVSPWSSSLRATASVPNAYPPASTSTSTSISNKRVRPTPTMSAIRHRLASKLVSAVQKTSHTDSGRPYTTIVECLNGEERRVCSAQAAAEASSATSYNMSPNALPPPPYKLFFTPEQAMTRVGWEVRTVRGDGGGNGGAQQKTATTIWTLYGNAASEWIQAALEGHSTGSGQQQPQPRQPFHVHPVPYDGPVRVGYGGKRQRMYAYAGIEALEAKLETATGDMAGMGSGDGILTLTVRTYLAGLVDEAKVTFSPWG